jgi:membrane fusion protein (multidrug efflux system)
MRGSGWWWAMLALAACEQNRAALPSSAAGSTAPAAAPAVPVVAVVSRKLDREIALPGDLIAYERVALYPKLPGFVASIGVDRGSVVRKGQLLVKLTAPELTNQRSAAEARAQAADARRMEAQGGIESGRADLVEAQARLASQVATYRRRAEAAKTPGVVAENDVEVARGGVEAARARVKSIQSRIEAMRAQERALQAAAAAERRAASSQRDIEGYLRVKAPFDGVVSERNVHPGSFVAPATGPGAAPMLWVQQIARLRLTVHVPEPDLGHIAMGAKLKFRVPAFPGRVFEGVLARKAGAVDARTRTMPVELDVGNRSGELAPGMYAEVRWRATRKEPTLWVPPSAIAVTTERAFVVRVKEDVAEWVDVRRGAELPDLVEVFGALRAGDWVAARGTDELRAGARVRTQRVAPKRSHAAAGAMNPDSKRP